MMGGEFSFANGTKCYIGRKTNLVALGQWLIKKGVKHNEMPRPVQKALKSYWMTQQVRSELRQAQIAVMVKCELEGMKPTEIAEKYGMDTATFSRFKSTHKELFRSEYDRYGSDARVMAIRSYLSTEQKLAGIMPDAADTVGEIIRNPEVGASVRARTSLELLKLMRQEGVQKRLVEFDEVFTELARETAADDFVLQDLVADGEVASFSELPPGEPDQFQALEGEVVAESVDAV